MSSSSSSSVPSKNSCHHHRRHTTLMIISSCNSCLVRETTAAQIPLCPNLQQGQVRVAARAWGSGGDGGHGGVGGGIPLRGGGGIPLGGGGGGGPGPESIYTLPVPEKESCNMIVTRTYPEKTLCSVLIQGPYITSFALPLASSWSERSWHPDLFR